jgi:hypothetical protein
MPTVGDHIAVQEALYRAASCGPEVELLLNSEIEVYGGTASVRSVSLVLGGDLRDPQIVSCRRVLDSLQRDGEGRWRVKGRVADDGPTGPRLSGAGSA